MKISRPIKWFTLIGLFLFVCLITAGWLIRSKGVIFQYGVEEQFCARCAAIQHRRTLCIFDIEWVMNSYKNSPLKREAFASVPHETNHMDGSELMFKSIERRLSLGDGYETVVYPKHGLTIHDNPRFIAAFRQLSERDPQAALKALLEICFRLSPYDSQGLPSMFDSSRTDEDEIVLMQYLEPRKGSENGGRVSASEMTR